MQLIIPHIINGNNFLLLQQKAIFWQDEKTLIVSDLHFGKTGHFRKSGIAVPQAVFKEDIQTFVSLLQTYKPKKVIVIGDMFHSHNNSEHDLFLKWRNDFSQLQIKLVLGNHDILPLQWYKNAAIETVQGTLQHNSFSFVHDNTEITNDSFSFCGHLHPVISISGIAKQTITLPCFYFTNTHCVLPAFSKFSGGYRIKPKKGETVFAVLPSNYNKNEQGGLMKIL